MALNWVPGGQELEIAPFGAIIPEQTLYELDSPMIFTFRDTSGLLLAYMCGEDQNSSRFIAVPTSASIVAELVSGYISVIAALSQPWCWCLDVDTKGTVIRCWVTSMGELPNAVLPAEDVLLNPALEPLFAVKVEGRNLGLRNVPASVVKRAVDGAYTALKKLSEEDGGIMGRPSETRRQLYDLSTRKVALGSFEISFGAPTPTQEVFPSLGEEGVQMVARGQELGAALGWAVDRSRFSEVPRLPMLEAMQKLAPPSQGSIETVIVSGKMLGGARTRFVLDRHAGRRVRQALSNARSRSEHVLTLSGVARELDKDKLSFRLRVHNSPDEYVCLFEEEQYDEIMEAFASDVAIEVALRLPTGTSQGEVLAISSKPENGAGTTYGSTVSREQSRE